MFAIPVEERVLCEDDNAGTAIAVLPEDHEGPCKVIIEGRTRTTLVFPDAAEAEAAAKFAVGVLGGYLYATVSPSDGLPVTHATWKDWAF